LLAHTREPADRFATGARAKACEEAWRPAKGEEEEEAYEGAGQAGCCCCC